MREISELITESVGSHIDNMLNERLLSVLSTKENVNLETLGFSSDAVEGCQAIITPIDIAGSVSEHCLSTNRMQRILLMILFSVNMVLL